jgi:hypothetical protein
MPLFPTNFPLFKKCAKKNSPRKLPENFFIPFYKLLQQVAGNRQTGHHDAHHAHQLDEDVQ